MSKQKSLEEFVFVIHKHAATRLHYDFRLQIGNTMPSWAIPKGPTLDPALKRLAMETTEHDIEYRHFEGVIPEGAYGAGGVMIWDEGLYIPEREIAKGKLAQIDDSIEGMQVMKQGLEKGEIKFQLQGKKLQGSFALVKTRGFGPKNSWLLIKHKDSHIQEGYDAKDYDYSASTNRSMKEIIEEGGR